jgi:hypothetical protein
LKKGERLQSAGTSTNFTTQDNEGESDRFGAHQPWQYLEVRVLVEQNEARDAEGIPPGEQ